MICKFCGNVIDDNSDFCFICGQKNPAEEVASVPAEENNDVFSEAPAAETPAPQAPAFVVGQTAPVAPEAAVYDDNNPAPVYAQSAPIYAQSAPVYAQQAIIQQVAPAQIVKTKNSGNVSVATKGSKVLAVIFSALFVLLFIPWIWYDKAKKAGYEQKSIDILNSIMIGLCIFMAVVGLFFIKSFML